MMQIQDAVERTIAVLGDGLNVEHKVIYPVIEISIRESGKAKQDHMDFVTMTADPLAILVVESLQGKEKVQYLIPLVD